MFLPEPDPRLPVTEARGTGSGGQPPILLVLANIKEKVLNLPHRLLSIDTEAKWGHGAKYGNLEMFISRSGWDGHFYNFFHFFNPLQRVYLSKGKLVYSFYGIRSLVVAPQKFLRIRPSGDRVRTLHEAMSRLNAAKGAYDIPQQLRVRLRERRGNSGDRPAIR